MSCGICYKRKLEVFLPCSHSVCVECYNKLIEKNCPYCGRLSKASLLGDVFFEEVQRSPFFDVRFSVVIDVYIKFIHFHRFTIPVNDNIWRDKNIMLNYLSGSNPLQATYDYCFTNYEPDDTPKDEDLVSNMDTLTI